MAEKWLRIVLLVGLSVGLHGMRAPQCGRMEKGTPPNSWPWVLGGYVQSADGRLIANALLIHESFVLTNYVRAGDYVVMGESWENINTEKIMVVEVFEHWALPGGRVLVAKLAHPVKFYKHICG